MAPTQPLLLISSLTLLLISIIAAATTIDAPKGFRVDLTRVDSSANITKLEHLRRSIKRNERKISRLAASASPEQVKAPVHTGNGEFLMSLSIGTPKVPFSAIVDTGSDLIWTQCKPYCKRCYDQPTPLFDPSASSSFSNVSCSTPLCDALPVSRCRSAVCEYLYAYGDESSTQHHLLGGGGVQGGEGGVRGGDEDGGGGRDGDRARPLLHFVEG
ncbi:Aspartic proteinase nepenthesin-1 [Acorus gramineus]|uniref:Aspartic proteinase nepenthesin-1 n=1 Tax=Acorus gramineus TaxID=55184 RepID=A0AAV9BU06_ACOGR|nr:Aspartic proteinase nepenthesin-1 [Acorus gramineus]